MEKNTNSSTIYIGNNPIGIADQYAHGKYEIMEGEEFYKIENVDTISPFFMSIVSDSDHWMFISSTGSLTAGRKNPGLAIFPYYTVDKIHDSQEITGSKTIAHITREDKTYLWEPFSERYKGVYRTERNIYKNVYGNCVIFEEINYDLEVIFKYSWNNSEKFGFVRKADIINIGKKAIEINLIDGIQNLLPFGVDRNMQNDKSVLIDAYKKNELIEETGLGIYVLSSIPVDRAEPSEALKATTVWSLGENIKKRLISSIQLEKFRKGFDIEQETDVRAHRGAYFVNIKSYISAEQSHKWYIIAEAAQSTAKVISLNKQIKENNNILEDIIRDIKQGTNHLIKIVASADGLQMGKDKLTTNRHFANVLFNVMRGGVFNNGYLISKADFIKFVKQLNIKAYEKYKEILYSLPSIIERGELKKIIENTNDRLLLRIGMEYMPLTFSRRHGDPSRPWNLFSIETRTENGEKILNYEGNWRDIFQNWEALSYSFPNYIESMIAKFVNASTPDGYNPYRVTRDGFDWEKQDPHDPWSFIGYWGDHQIIYLLKFLEHIDKFFPGTLQKLFKQDIFTFANVPYRIKPYEEILRDPHHSIMYDEKLEQLIASRIKEYGTDGKLVFDQSENIYFVNLTEKILITTLVKIANFIPEAGIWMNTQRPEWNDANNALVGYGVSVVTLCHLRRFVSFCHTQFMHIADETIELSIELLNFFSNILQVLEKNTFLLNSSIKDYDRKRILDLLGGSASEYRKTIYEKGFSNRKEKIKAETIAQFFNLLLQYLDHSIKSNKRPDNLYHSYNIISITDSGISITHLYEMLEGQVAVLNSGLPDARESLEILKALKQSSMFNPRERSELLYPDRTLPRFIEKNNIPSEAFQKLELFQTLANANDTSIIECDAEGNYHFNGNFVNKNKLNEALERLLETSFATLVKKEKDKILELYEQMFQHKFFTGRSGTFFGYEGLGCIYWHMVSKLLLAAGEVTLQANLKGEKDIANHLKEVYYDIRKGLGFNKTPGEYGAFPTDPYSHTPGHGGAQQPGMTGQVKEDIISRWMELGITIYNGCIEFTNFLLRKQEFLNTELTFMYIDVNGNEQNIKLEKDSLAFTLCQVPIIYQISHETQIQVVYKHFDKIINTLRLDKEISQSIFNRKGEIERIIVKINPSND